MVNVIQQAIEALEEAQTGLAWYRDRNPDQSDGSDDEAALRIEHAIHNLRAAQEGDLPPLLTDERIAACIDEANRNFNGRKQGPSGQQMTTYDDWKYWLARAIESEVRLALAAAGGGVPHDALIQARDMLESWSSYVPPYFAEKHGLKDDFSTLDAWIAAAPGSPLTREKVLELAGQIPAGTELTAAKLKFASLIEAAHGIHSREGESNDH